MLELITVTKIGGMWCVVYGEVIFGRSTTTAEAIQHAVMIAARVAQRGQAAQVMVDDMSAPRIVWDSTRDAYSVG